MKPKDLAVHIIQPDIQWEQAAKNLEHIEQLIKPLDYSDLIVLPEMFNTGFSMNVEEMSEDWNGNTCKWMLEMAKKTSSVIMGSLIFKEKHNYFNRLIAVYPDKSKKYYNKRHLFRLGDEHNYYKEGNSYTTIQVKDWKIRMLICYDLRFPVWSRNTDGYDLLVYVANWPLSRVHAWKTLLMARAIENQAFVIGANRIGSDGNSIRYGGESLVIDPLGKLLNKPIKNKESVISTNLNFNSLSRIRKKFPVLLDRENFTLKDKGLS
jgi:predicted amidohydrolase